MRKPLLAILLLLACASVLLLAQTAPPTRPPGPPDPQMMIQHRVQFLTTMLSLTAAQQQQATAILSNEATGMESFHQSMRTAHQSLDSAIKANDSAGIDQAASTIGNLTAQSIAAHAKASAAVYQILTPDQQTKYSQLEREHGNVMFMRGPGFGFVTGGGPKP